MMEMVYGVNVQNAVKLYTEKIYNQMEMYVDKKLKSMTLDKKKIFEEAVRIYNPN